MTHHLNFLAQLQNLHHESQLAAQYLYSDMAVQHAASKSKKLLSRLNATPRFWLAHSAASQVAAYFSIARAFDRSSPFNLEALLKSFEANLQDFSREALAIRKQDGKATDPVWLEEYLERAYYPTQKDVDRLRRKVVEYREIYARAVEPARHKYFAHRVKVDRNEVQALFSAGKVSELWRLVMFLHVLHEALWQQYHNGRKPILKPVRYSVKTIYESKSHSSAPHEAVIAQTKELMKFLETATPDPSVKSASISRYAPHF